LPGRIDAAAFDIGGEGVAYHDTDPENRAGGRETGVDVDGGVVGDDDPGEWREYTISAAAGTYDVTALVATPNDDCGLRLSVDGAEIGTVDVPATGSWDDYEAVTLAGVSIDALEAGVLRMETTGDAYNLDWVDFEETTAPVVDGTTYVVRAEHSGKALDVREREHAPGATVQQWAYGGGMNQQWRVDAVGDGEYTLTAVHSQQVLDVAFAAEDDGADVQQWPRNGGDQQRWELDQVEDGLYRITNVNSGKALDVAGVSTDDGASVQQWEYGGGENQHWRFERL
jgi:hypothetical protein